MTIGVKSATTKAISSPATDTDTCTGAELIIDILERKGVEIVAGIPGGALLPLYDALARSKKLRHILARHEQAAGFIAQGMARMTGKAGVCFATSGPGVTNIVTALADAKLDSIPLVCIAGQVPTHLIGTDAFQEVATVAMTTPITKAAIFVQHVNDLEQAIRDAFVIAESGRPGPVLIDVPKDVQLQRCLRSSKLFKCAASHASFAQDTDYDRVATLIANAKRPLLYVGGGVVKARAHLEIKHFAERTSIPMTTTLMALGILPPEHPLNLGMLGMHGARFTNHAIAECDLLIALGARFDDRATGDPHRFAEQAQIIHIDIDARELGKIKQPTLGIVDDAAHALRKLEARVASRACNDWNLRIEELRNRYPLIKPHAQRLCSAYGIVQAVGKAAPRDAIVTTDVGQHQMWVAQAYPFYRPDRFLTSGGLGTMGFGLPTAIGAALVEPDATTVCFSGDGSLLMNVQEFATLAELDLNVKIILLDNSSLGLVRQQQNLFYKRRYSASSFVLPSNWVAIAHAFGIPAIDLGTAHCPDMQLSQLLLAEGPALIRVPIDADEQVLPMVAPGDANVAAIDHPISDQYVADQYACVE